MLTEALSAYGLASAEAHLIGHSENLTYQVTCPAGRYVLRIHQPKEGMSTAAFDSRISPVELRRTEMAFLRHLAAKKLPVQRPMANLRGEDVTLLSSGICVTLLSWLEGEALTAEDITAETSQELGALCFRLHDAARDFIPAVSRRYDAAHCPQAAFVISGLSLAEDDKAILIQALARISSIWENQAGAAVMIHADLSPSNVLRTSAGLAPIDFSLGGLGHPMFDLAVLTAQVPMQQLESCKSGYAAAGGTLDEADYAAGFALGVIGMIVLFGEGMAKEAWFPGVMAQWRKNILLPLLEGEEKHAKS